MSIGLISIFNEYHYLEKKKKIVFVTDVRR